MAAAPKLLIVITVGVLIYLISSLTITTGPLVNVSYLTHFALTVSVQNVSHGVVEYYNRYGIGGNLKTEGLSEAVGSKDVVAKRFDERLKNLHSKCPSNYLDSPKRQDWFPIPNILVDVPRRILACVVPKAGSSSWHGLFWAIRRKRAGLSQDQKHYNRNDTIENHRMAKKLSIEDGRMLSVPGPDDDDFYRSPRKNRSHRLILTRHPFARLISGWNDKFKVGSEFGLRLFERFPLMMKYRVTSPMENFTFAFEDFARYVADNGRDMRRLDYHFRPVEFLCKPCEYAYTYILKAECVNEDQQWLMRRLNLTDMDVVRRGVASNGSLLQRNPSDLIKSMFSKLSKDTIQKLFLVYEKDFLYFNYTFNFDTMDSAGFE